MPAAGVPGASVIVYTGANQTGTAYADGTVIDGRYARKSFVENGYQLFEKLSSATVYAPEPGASSLILFSDALFPTQNASNYEGHFLQLTNAGPEGEFDVNLASHDFNNLATSMLVVYREKGTEFRLSFREFFLEDWNDTVDDQLPSNVQRDGDPRLTWKPFPNQSKHIYLEIYQPLDIILDGWPDYKAWIRYRLQLHHNNGVSGGHVHSWAYWIESGLKASDIEEQLAPAVVQGVNTLNNRLAERLGDIPFSVGDIYYLPGRQLEDPHTGAILGHTDDDVTIVFEVE
jgi:hypothetical protein